MMKRCLFCCLASLHHSQVSRLFAEAGVFHDVGTYHGFKRHYLSISCCFNVKWQAGAIVIAGLISPYAADRDYAREAVSAFFESVAKEKETSSKELSR